MGDIVNVEVKLVSSHGSETIIRSGKGSSGELFFVEDNEGRKFVLIKGIYCPISSSREWSIHLLIVGVVPIPLPIPGRKREEFAELNLLIDPSKITDIDESGNTIRIEGSRKLIFLLSSEMKGFPKEEYKKIEISLDFPHADKIRVSEIYSTLTIIWTNAVTRERMILEKYLENILKNCRDSSEEIDKLSEFIKKLDEMIENDNISKINHEYLKNKCKERILKLLKSYLKT